MRTNKQIQGIVFKKDQEGIKFLLLKRTKSRGDFWQFVTGGIEDFDKSLKDSLIRELEEETKLKEKEIIRIVGGIGVFKFEHKKQMIEEQVFGVEINSKAKISIDKKEHEKSTWATYEEAKKLLKFESNKKALENLINKIN
jgi:8-oxo-dGTP pyrophosphatase MutT (NUDIX family)